MSADPEVGNTEFYPTSQANLFPLFLFNSMEFAKQPAEVRKLQQEIKKREWDVNLVDSSQGADSEVGTSTSTVPYRTYHQDCGSGPFLPDLDPTLAM